MTQRQPGPPVDLEELCGPGSWPRILVCDDEPSIRALARSFFEEWGLLTEEATDGHEALELAVQEAPDLILLDAKMPRMDGFETLRRLREIPSCADVPVVMATSPGDSLAIDRAFELKAIDFVSKPINWVVLRYRVIYMLRLRRLLQQNQSSARRLADAQRLSRLGHWDWDRTSGLVRCSAEMVGLVGQGEHEAWCDPADLLSVIDPRDRGLARRFLRLALTGAEVPETDLRIRLASGLERAIRCRAERSIGSDGRLSGLAGTALDITEARRLEAARRLLSEAVEQSPAAVIITDPVGRIQYVNRRFREMTGFEEDDIRHCPASMLTSERTSEEIHKDLWRAVSEGREWRGEVETLRQDGEAFWVTQIISPIIEDGDVSHLVWSMEDISVRKEYEDRLIRQANYDDLTGLPNRLLGLDRLGQALAAARRSDDPVAVLFFDLDDFRSVNDSRSHSFGDDLLKEVAKRLRRSVTGGNSLARTGGDEFLIVARAAGGAEEAARLASSCLESFGRVVEVGGVEVLVNASVGIALSPDDGDDPHLLIRNAEAAMYRAKERSGNSFEFFSPALSERAAKRLEVAVALRKALEQGELYLQFQPIVSLDSREMVAAEALLRWNSQSLGPVFPDTFIPVAEDTGLIVPIGEWVMRTACREARRWERETGRRIRVAVNVSPRQVNGEDIVGVVQRALGTSGLEPDRLELEITERLLVEDGPEAEETLRQLRLLGVRLALDDFGTGQSSLGNLRRMPMDVVKIDRSFLASMDNSDPSLLAAIFGMARALSLEVVVEGVETGSQLELLENLQGDLAQGYLFAKPRSADDFLELLRAPGWNLRTVAPLPAVEVAG